MSPATINVLTYIFEEEHLEELESLSRSLDSLAEEDRNAIYRSLAWLSQGIRLEEPAARFLFSILAIESLATYIEGTAPDDSPLAKLRTEYMTEPEREQCIRDVLTKGQDNLKKAVERAYFDCVRSITDRLKRHLQKVLGTNTRSYDLLFRQKVDGRTLYDLRSYVAHGSINALSEAQRDQIRQRVSDAEQVAQTYIWAVFGQALGVTPGIIQIQASVSVSGSIVAGNERMYGGPVHMAEIYCR